MTPYSTGKVAIGSRYEPPRRPTHTTYSEDQVQAALLEWHRRSANDSRIMAFGGHMAPPRPHRVKPRRWRTVRRFVRSLAVFLAADRVEWRP